VNKKTTDEGDNAECKGQHQPQQNDAGKMFTQQMVILSNIFIVEIGDSKIEKDIEKERKIKKCDVVTINLSTHSNLNIPVNAKNPKRLDQQVEGQNKEEVGYKLALHVLF
jgi:hypothetical protein